MIHRFRNHKTESEFGCSVHSNKMHIHFSHSRIRMFTVFALGCALQCDDQISSHSRNPSGILRSGRARPAVPAVLPGAAFRLKY
eukprot:4440662-Pyramimonas_sp.AAC.1